MADQWRTCGSCKKPIAYGATYMKCSVSTCNRARFQLVFCSLRCWDAHVPVMNHRSAWATEQTAPPAPASLPRLGSQPTSGASPSTTPQPASRTAPTTRRRAGAGGGQNTGTEGRTRRVVRPDTMPSADREILVVVSRLKKYISARSGGMSTSADVMEILSDMIRIRADEAIREARKDGRKTVMARDFQ